MNVRGPAVELVIRCSHDSGSCLMRDRGRTLVNVRGRDRVTEAHLWAPIETRRHVVTGLDLKGDYNLFLRL